MYNSGNDNNRKKWFRKARLKTNGASSYSKISWSITLMWDNDQVLGIEYSLQCFGIGLFLMWGGQQVIEYRLSERKIFELNTCKGERQ